MTTAEPTRAPGWAPPDHQPSFRGLDGGTRVPRSAVIPTTAASISNRGTDSRTGLPGFAASLGDGVARAGALATVRGGTGAVGESATIGRGLGAVASAG
ncbi:hypothetical protein GCM10009534_16740 [Kribbella sandramycini]